jgi:hypothetical protein
MLFVHFALTAVHSIRQPLNIVKLLQAFFKTHDLVFDVIFELIDRWVTHYFVRCWIVLFFDHLRVPFNRDVADFEKVGYQLVDTWLDDAAAALVDPVALGARVALAIHHLQYERL